MWRGRYDAALAHWQQALEMHRNYRVLHSMAEAYAAKGMYREAVEEVRKGLALSGAGSWETAVLVHLYGRMGRVAEGRTVLAEMLSGEDVAPYDVAIAYAGLGENDAAFKSLETALENRSGAFNELNADPIFDRLWPDQRFASLVRMGVPAQPPSLARLTER